MYNEQDTRNFFNKEDALYRSLWSKDGNLHWGYFPRSTVSIEQGMRLLTERMLILAKIPRGSEILELCCGNGVTSETLLNKTHAKRVIGVDFSEVRIKNARETYYDQRHKLGFHCSSVTRLELKNSSFTHVWSHSSLYHVHDKPTALREVKRVLKPGGLFVFDDLYKPRSKISALAEEHLYDRLMFDTPYDFVSYQAALSDLGFDILNAEDLSEHYARTYDKLVERIDSHIEKGVNEQFHEQYKELKTSYQLQRQFVENRDIGWAMYIARKR
jgi:ubiquinone/menaquinone biosynthesis C-methylase UbiE